MCCIEKQMGLEFEKKIGGNIRYLGGERAPYATRKGEKWWDSEGASCGLDGHGFGVNGTLRCMILSGKSNVGGFVFQCWKRVLFGFVDDDDDVSGMVLLLMEVLWWCNEKERDSVAD
ncbi:unnamed protein product [Dovyalis caffra]|uniref:Uncharacterized protein n=1 Tax=Dovyalis caffra TaxID=77055 RepID=A0AAV1SV10_9ROSI|nr:unnamed protein product [Dovyalis caffra]